MSICFYSFCCHVNLFAKYRELDEPSSRRVNKVLYRSVGLEVVVYTLVGVCGFLALGPPCENEVPKTQWPSCTPINVLASPRFAGADGIVARIAMIITLLVCIPLNLNAGREVLDQRIFKLDRGDTRAMPMLPSPTGSPGPSTTDLVQREQTPLVWHLGVSLSFLYLAALIAIVYQHINVILSILGGGCAVTFMFTLPILATLFLYFGIASLGSNAPPGTPQIGRFLGVTASGVVLSTFLTGLCICVGYLSAGLAVVDLVTGKP